MPIYGYKKAVIDEEFGLLDLREISLELSPNDLRRLARFFEHYAREIESGGWRSGHVHIESFDPTWRADHPDADVIILNTEPDPPSVVD